jgi:hypothetical protein
MLSAWVLVLVVAFGAQTAHPIVIDMPSKALCEAAKAMAKQQRVVTDSTIGTAVSIPLAFCLPRSQEQ